MTPLATTLPAVDPNAMIPPTDTPRSALQALAHDMRSGLRRLLRRSR